MVKVIAHFCEGEKKIVAHVDYVLGRALLIEYTFPLQPSLLEP